MSKRPPSDLRHLRRPPNREVPLGSVGVRPRGGGFSAEGPGFYVWDDFACETRRQASELREVAPRHRSPVG